MSELELLNHILSEVRELRALTLSIADQEAQLALQHTVSPRKLSDGSAAQVRLNHMIRDPR
jgi:hypothetical protein